ncbi:MAG TPA: hypothetical protein V6C97_21620, partial [Oculatellaceae cyanobacterium]
EYMSNCFNSYLPLYSADRHLFAFRNGIYSTLEDKFWQWQDVPSGSVACNYIDADFDDFADKTNQGHFWPQDQPADNDEEWWDEWDDDWFKIPTPSFDKIFRTQVSCSSSSSCSFVFVLVSDSFVETMRLRGTSNHH